jgi:uncharacterized protein (TIGR03437 family)
VVPESLDRVQTALLQIVRDGVPSAVSPVALVEAAPSILAGSVSNQDGSSNGVSAPEKTGNLFRVLATGLPRLNPESIFVLIHDRTIEAPSITTALPSSPGLQRVEFAIPVDLPTMSTEVRLCAGSPSDPSSAICSRPESVWIEYLEVLADVPEIFPGQLQ